MSSPTVTHRRRAVPLATGEVRFEVALQITDPGDLPFAELFLVTIVDPANPKLDALARLATPLELREQAGIVYVKVLASDVTTIGADTFAKVPSAAELTTFLRDRTAAVQRGATQYLTSAVTLLYASVDLATAAYQTFNARLSQLVADWRTYTTAFATNPTQDYLLPVVGQSVEDQLTAAYRAAKTARRTAEAARDTAAATLATCRAEGAADAALFNVLAADAAFLDAAKAYVTGLAASDARTFALNAADPTSYEALRLAKRAALATLRTRLAAHAEECAANAAAVLDAQRGVDAARRTEDAALVPLQNVCPTFDPNSV